MSVINFFAEIKDNRGTWREGEFSLHNNAEGIITLSSVNYVSGGPNITQMAVASYSPDEEIRNRRRFPATIYPRTARINLNATDGSIVQLELCPHNRSHTGERDQFETLTSEATKLSDQANMVDLDELNSKIPSLGPTPTSQERADEYMTQSILRHNLDKFAVLRRRQENAYVNADREMGCADYWRVIKWLEDNGLVVQDIPIHDGGKRKNSVRRQRARNATKKRGPRKQTTKKRTRRMKPRKRKDKRKKRRAIRTTLKAKSKPSRRNKGTRRTAK